MFDQCQLATYVRLDTYKPSVFINTFTFIRSRNILVTIYRKYIELIVMFLFYYLYLYSIRDKAKNSCSKLFLEIVSEIIFSVSSSALDEPPEDKLVSELIKTVIPSTGSTQQLSPLTESKADEIPVVRSYLLQLLLDYEYVT